jgi:NADPH2:quinone reductase
MQALQIDHHGPVSALTVRDVPRPAVGPQEVLIEIEAAALNPSDIASAEGRFEHVPLPRILGHDFAGRVCDGPADLLGQEVWGSGGDLGIGRDGTHAEYIALPRDGVALRPRVLSVEEAADVGVPFLAAWAALMDRGRLQEGEWVIISGAAGAVGSAAVQIAATRHARIIALVRNARDDARVDAQKVAAIAHAESQDVAEVVREATGGTGVHLALNAIGGSLFQPLLDVLAAEGRMVCFSAMGGREVPLDLLALYRKNLTVHGLNTAGDTVVHGATRLNQLAPLFASGAIPPPRIAARYPLSQAAEAYQHAAGSKVVLIPDRVYHPETARTRGVTDGAPER